MPCEARWPPASSWTPIDTAGEGVSDYAGPLLSDVDFGAFSHSALVRIADEVCLQMHLLSWALPVLCRRGSRLPRRPTCRARQLIGIAGLAASRLHASLHLPDGVDGALEVLAVHPLLNPAAYVSAWFDESTVGVSRSPAHEDGAWIARCGPGRVEALQAIVRAVDPHLDVTVVGDRHGLDLPRGPPRHPRPRPRRGGRHPDEHRRRLRVPPAAVVADHPGLT